MTKASLERKKKNLKKIYGTSYVAETGKYQPTEFTIALEYDREGNCFSINDGIRKWTVCASDVLSILF